MGKPSLFLNIPVVILKYVQRNKALNSDSFFIHFKSLKTEAAEKNRDNGLKWNKIFGE